MNAHNKSTIKYSTEWCDADVSEIKYDECQQHYPTNEFYVSIMRRVKILSQ